MPPRRRPLLAPSRTARLLADAARQHAAMVRGDVPVLTPFVLALLVAPPDAVPDLTRFAVEVR